MPVLEREEYIEQAYFFHTFRERLIDGLPAQDILGRIGEELLSTTKLPMAVSFLHIELKANGQIGPAMVKLGHYFTLFQAHVISQAEQDLSRFAMEQALLVLEREAKFKTEGPSLPALFVFHFEAIAQPAGIHPRTGRHRRRPVLYRRLERLHPYGALPLRRRRFRRPDLRSLRVLRQRAPPA